MGTSKANRTVGLRIGKAERVIPLHLVQMEKQSARPYVVSGGKGCRICKGSGWIEILGCGMVHPNVLKFGDYDTEKYTGFAFGIGVERIAMLKYGIDDMRLLYENDIRFISQFR